MTRVKLTLSLAHTVGTPTRKVQCGEQTPFSTSMGYHDHRDARAWSHWGAEADACLPWRPRPHSALEEAVVSDVPGTAGMTSSGCPREPACSGSGSGAPGNGCHLCCGEGQEACMGNTFS